MASESNEPLRAPDPYSDLGFGAVVARETRRRFLNRDGTFNVRRAGLRYMETLSGYHYLLTISWPRFLAWLVSTYLLANAFFAAIYVAAGRDSLAGAEHLDTMHRYMKAFFFSVHTLGTIGYGNVYPTSLAADIVVTIEALTGLLAFAVVAGIVFARFARPVARIVYSERAVIAPYREGTRAFMFRIANQKNNQLVELEAKVMLTRRKPQGTNTDREFIALKLERDRVVFFPLSWTIVHPIDERSPLWGATPEDLERWDAEFLILLNGFDETFSQTVHSRSSYKFDEVKWGARFRSMFVPPDEQGILAVDVRRLHDVDEVAG